MKGSTTATSESHRRSVGIEHPLGPCRDAASGALSTKAGGCPMAERSIARGGAQ